MQYEIFIISKYLVLKRLDSFKTIEGRKALYYLFITYIVTSKPKRISVADGVVHMIIPFQLVCQDCSLTIESVR